MREMSTLVKVALCRRQEIMFCHLFTLNDRTRNDVMSCFRKTHRAAFRWISYIDIQIYAKEERKYYFPQFHLFLLLKFDCNAIKNYK